MQNFRIIKHSDGLVKLAYKALEDSQYNGHPDLSEQRRPDVGNGPILLYAYVDLQTSYAGRRDTVLYKPVLCYCTLNRRAAKRLVYFRTEKEGPAMTISQLILSSDGFTAFVTKLEKNLMSACGHDKEALIHATTIFDRHMAELEKAFKKWHKLQFFILRRTFEYSVNGTHKYTPISYPIYLDPGTAREYIYARKNNLFSKRSKVNKKLDTFQNYVHPMFDLDLPEQREKKKRKFR